MRGAPESAVLRIAGFVGVLGLLFGAAFGLGRLVDAPDTPDASEIVPVAGSYELRLEAGAVAEDSAEPVRFTIVDQDEQVVTRYDLQHEKRLHLIAVRTGFDGFQHVHPTMAEDGTWSVPLAVFNGKYRLFADFQEAGGTPSVAYADLVVSGTSELGFTSVPPQVTRTTTVDGYTVALVGDLVPGSASTLTLSVERDGADVTDLQPYLGAYGHLVVLRGTDQEYLHAHPQDGPAGPEVPFHVEVATPGRYFLYLDFQHRDEVRTAQFALDTGSAGSGADQDHGAGHDDH